MLTITTHRKQSAAGKILDDFWRRRGIFRLFLASQGNIQTIFGVVGGKVPRFFILSKFLKIFCAAGKIF
jgi:hypothetical protein